MSVRAVDVALPLPVQSTFTYRIPEPLTVPERGMRVVAPFGPRRVIGVVTGVLDEDEEAAQGRELKDVLDVIDESPLAPTPLLDLATPGGISAQSQRHSLDLLKNLNEQHAANRPAETAHDSTKTAAGYE